MSNTLAVHWEKSKDSLYYMVIDPKSLAVHLRPTTLAIKQNRALTQISGLFSNSSRFIPLNLNYKILSHGSPASPTYKKPNKLSLTVLNEVKSNANSNGYSINTQLRSKLSGDSLKIFKSCLHNLKLVTQRQGNAYQIHLWSVALHATKSNLRNTIKHIWSKSTNTSMKTKVGKKNFAAWYKNL